MSTGEISLRSAAEKLSEPMKEKGLGSQYETLMILVDRAEELSDPGMIVCLSSFFLRVDLAPLKEDEDLEEDLNALLTIIAKMMSEFVNPEDTRILSE